MEPLADAGDHVTFDTLASLFSEDGANAPDVRPNGLIAAVTVTPAITGTDNHVDVPSSSCNLNGVIASVTASPGLVISGAATDVSSVSIVTINAAGSYVVVQGTDGTDATFSEVYGDPGGPPFVPVDSIAVAQIRLPSNVPAPITNDEIFQVDGTHMETSTFPGFDTANFTGKVVFDSALILNHTGGVTKAVQASYAEPVFVKQKFANDFVPADEVPTSSSETVYQATIASFSTDLGAASFTAILSDGITDRIVQRAGSNLMFRYTQDEAKTPHILTQGRYGVAMTHKAEEHPKATITISAETKSFRVA